MSLPAFAVQTPVFKRGRKNSIGVAWLNVFRHVLKLFHGIFHGPASNGRRLSMLEIERKFLLDGLPSLPGEVDVWQVEQGYLAPPNERGPMPGNDARQPALPKTGRIRRIVFADGSIICTHSIKTGSGLVRNEIERTITIEHFEQLWPRTAGRRLRKRRHRVHIDHSVWEIDDFEGVDLVLAEIELPRPDTPVLCPPWLQPHIVREVTDDPHYTNSAIAARISGTTR